MNARILRPLAIAALLCSAGLAVAALGLALDESGFFRSESGEVQAGEQGSELASPSPSGTAAPATTSPPTTAPTSSSTSTAAEAADPTRVRIPTISVDAPTTPLGLRDDGSIEVPENFAETGWWRDGPEPGEIGPAVILGHVDSRNGPAVFYDLRTMAVGDEILVDRADGSTVTYVVDRIEQHPKSSFPTEDVYGPTDDVQLRLVTCGGDFDRSQRSYRDNVIVFASAVGGA